MNKNIILNSIKKLRETSKKRNFTQTIDLIINLKGLDIKKPDEKIDLYIALPHKKGKEPKICAFVDNELSKQSNETFDKTILKEDFSKYSKVAIKKLAKEFKFFIAQANIMPQVAQNFGKILGPKQKMPNPKAGQIVPPTIPNLQSIKEKLSKTVHLITRNEALVRTAIGTENMKDEEIADNIFSIYNAIIHILPQEKNNIKSILIKFTMGPSVEIGEDKK